VETCLESIQALGRGAFLAVVASVVAFGAMARLFVSTLLGVLLLAATSAAETAPAAQAESNPRGIKGVSPFWESIKNGDNAYLARDFDGAIAAYRHAITQQPQHPMGHYRLGAAQAAKGDQKEAELAWSAGLRFADKDPIMKAKLLFVLADLRERQKAYDDADARWTEYGKHANQHQNARAYPATADDRKKRIAAAKQLATEYAEVKQRIEKRLKEAEEAARKNAK
jgi:tetratricopeptide (TPR) repeat protein